MESVKVAYTISHLEKALNAVHKLSPECVEKIKECLELLNQKEKEHPPYTGHSLEFDYHSLRS